MKRKVIQLNPTTLAVTLPKKWAEKNGILKGDELHVEEKARQLIMQSLKASIIGEKVLLDIPKLGTFEKNFISTLYQAGVDEIEIIYDDPRIIPLIQQQVNTSCIGFDIVEHTKNILIIKSISQDIVIDFEKLYKKNIQIIAVDEYKSAIKKLSENAWLSGDIVAYFLEKAIGG